MLKALRSGTHSKVVKYFFLTLLMLGTVGLALFGIQDVFRGGGRSATVASIDGDKISRTEFERIVQEVLRQQQVTREEAVRAGVPQRALEREINSRLFMRESADLGLAISDDLVRAQLDDILKPMMEKGLSKRDALQNVLHTFNTTERQLVASLKAEIAITKLTHALANGASVPQQMVEDFMKYRYEWRRGEYFRLTATDAGVKDPTPEELQEFYADMQSNYMLPEFRSFAVLVLDAKALGIESKTGANDARAFYDANIAQYTVPAKRQISLVSVPDEESAQKIHEKAVLSDSLKKAAESVKGARYVTGSYSKEEFIPVELVDEAFANEPGTILPPVKGSLGWNIIHVESETPASTRPFEEVKAEIEKFLAARDSTREALYTRVGEIDDMVGAGKTLSEIAQQLGLKEAVFEKVSADGQTAAGKKAEDKGVPAFDKVLTAVFQLDTGLTSQMIETPTGEFILAETREIVPAQPRPLDAVRAEVADAWKQKQAGAALDAKATKIMERLNMGEPLEKLAKEFGKEVRKTALLQRGAPPAKAESIEPGVMLALFSIDKLGQATAVPAPGAVTILRLAERKIEKPPAQSREDVDALQSMLNLALQSDILEQFRKNLMAKYDVTINERAVREAFAPASDTDTR